MSKRVRYLTIGLLLAAVGLAAYDRMLTYRWVGSTDLTVEFVVVDAETRQPIDGADIAAIEPGKPRADPIRWTTDRDGIAQWEGKTWVSGRQSGLLLTDTCSIGRPDWLLCVDAPGYEKQEPGGLNESASPFRGTVVQAGPAQSKLVVPIALHRSQP